MSIPSATNHVENSPQSIPTYSSPRIPPFLKVCQEHWRAQDQSALFRLPPELLGVVGEKLFLMSYAGRTELSKVVTRFAVTCKAAYSIAHQFSSGLDGQNQQELAAHMHGALRSSKSASGILRKAVLFIHALTPSTIVNLDCLLPPGATRKILLDHQTLQYLPAITITLKSSDDAAELVGAMEEQLALAPEARTRIRVDLQPGRDLELDHLIEAARAHGRVEFLAPERMTAAVVVKLADEDMLESCYLHDECGDTLFTDFMDALIFNTSLKSLVANVGKAKLERLLEALAKSSLQELIIIPADTAHTGKALASFVRSHVSLTKLVIREGRVRKGEHQSPEECQAAALELDSAIRTRKDANSAFCADISSFFKTGNNPPRVTAKRSLADFDT